MADTSDTLWRVDFEPIGKRVDTAGGKTLLEAAQQGGIMLNATCGGAAKCGQCRVVVIEGQVSDPTAEEKALLGDAALAKGERLACCTRIRSDVKVDVPVTSFTGKQRLQLNGHHDMPVPEPAVRAHTVDVAPPTLEDTRSDLERLSPDKAAYNAEPWVLQQSARLAREHQWHLELYTRDSEIIGTSPAGERPLGVAIDLGTTKIAASLMDLANGIELAVAGAMNPQIAYGEDLISRLSYAHQHPDGEHTMASVVRQTLDGLLGELVEKTGRQRRHVADICIVANTAMTHLLLGLPTEQLAVAPFVAATNRPVDIKARDLGLNVSPGAYVHVLPCIGGFVGADHVAMIMASNLDHPSGVTLGIDIGTNTEIVLANQNGLHLTCASCASGPAFEGAHVGDGMRAASGAIEAVKIGDAGIQLTTIDQAAPIGLCGSGMVDALAELLRCKALSKMGRLNQNSPYLREGAIGPDLLLAPAATSGSGRDVVLNQKDISQIQLAKGAIRAGLDVLMNVTRTSAETIDEVVVAGAFGAFMDLRNALDIGLLPRLPNARYQQVGNAALVGAKRALLSVKERERAMAVAARAKHIELSTSPDFTRLFAKGMQFPEL